MRAGTVLRGNLMLRCPFCGDSEADPLKGHFSVELGRGLYQCFRCKVSGRLTTQQLFQLQTSGVDIPVTTNTSDLEFEALLPFIQSGPGTERFSSLSRYHVSLDNQTRDAFFMRDPYDSAIIGVHLRGPDFAKSLGEVGLGWVSDDILTSSPLKPLRLVEGPYDVIYENDVCLFGLISQAPLRWLAGHHVVLIPDGDVWQNPTLANLFFASIRKLLKANIVNIVGIELIPGGKDPDELKPSQRPFMSRADLVHFLAKQSNARRGYV